MLLCLSIYNFTQTKKIFFFYTNNGNTVIQTHATIIPYVEHLEPRTQFTFLSKIFFFFYISFQLYNKISPFPKKKKNPKTLHIFL